jgi:cardiolipin synthase
VVPVWVVVLIVFRDLVLGLFLVLLKRKGHGPWKVTYLGKAATFNLLYALPLLLLTDTSSGWVSSAAFVAGWSFAGWGIALYLWTGIGYARAGITTLKS